ncbi:MAG: glycosyltransferase involved in cell wall biosynthesis [Candidatus Omnitrophota bacterium]|jgi:glycosyltransferase involved in cell wall biosynthesis
MAIPLSLIVITKNEENNLDDCLKDAHGWVDEIIIVDDESTDRTREIAQKYTDKIFIRKMKLEGVQRNYGVAQAKNEWVMMLDCDERLTPEVKDEISKVVVDPNPEIVAYWVPRKNYIGDYWLQHGGYYPAQHIKLYQKQHLCWKEVHYDLVHPGITLAEGQKGGHLKEHIIHFNYRNVEDHIAKTNRHTSMDAMKWHLMGKKMNLGKALWRMNDRFWRRFLRKKGYKDGYHGFVVAVLSGFYEFATYSKYREIQHNREYFKQYDIEDKCP